MMKVTPLAELCGEGNGWDECDEATATMWEVGDDDEVWGAYTTRKEAEAELIKAIAAENR